MTYWEHILEQFRAEADAQAAPKLPRVAKSCEELREGMTVRFGGREFVIKGAGSSWWADASDGKARFHKRAAAIEEGAITILSEPPEQELPDGMPLCSGGACRWVPSGGNKEQCTRCEWVRSGLDREHRGQQYTEIRVDETVEAQELPEDLTGWLAKSVDGRRFVAFSLRWYFGAWFVGYDSNGDRVIVTDDDIRDPSKYRLTPPASQLEAGYAAQTASGPAPPPPRREHDFSDPYRVTVAYLGTFSGRHVARRCHCGATQGAISGETACSGERTFDPAADESLTAKLTASIDADRKPPPPPRYSAPEPGRNGLGSLSCRMAANERTGRRVR